VRFGNALAIIRAGELVHWKYLMLEESLPATVPNGPAAAQGHG